MALTEQDIDDIKYFQMRYFNDAPDQILKNFQYWTPFTQREKNLIAILLKSTGLFTGGNVATVRNPELFNPAKAAEWGDLTISEYLNRPAKDPETGKDVNFLNYFGIQLDGKPTKEDYQNAHDLLSFLSSNVSGLGEEGEKQVPAVLWRGLFNVTQNLLSAWIQKDSIFDLGNIVSCSWSKDVALNFSEINFKRMMVLLEINNKNRIGMFADKISVYPHEAEIILSGKVKTISFSADYINFDHQQGFFLSKTTDPGLILASMEFIKDVDSKGYIEIGDSKFDAYQDEYFFDSFVNNKKWFLNQVFKIYVDLI